MVATMAVDIVVDIMVDIMVVIIVDIMVVIMVITMGSERPTPNQWPSKQQALTLKLNLTNWKRGEALLFSIRNFVSIA